MDDISTFKESLKADKTECEICHRNFEEAKLTKCAKQLTFPADQNHYLVICNECNYRMYLQEIENIKRLRDLNQETKEEIKKIMLKFQEKRDDIVSDSILNVVGCYSVKRRPHLDLLYKYPNWNLSNDEIPEIEMMEIKKDYEKLYSLAKELCVWNGNKVDQQTSKKIKELKKIRRTDESK